MLITLGTPPSDAETDSWYGIAAAAHARDLPASTPERSRIETEGKLRVPPVGARTVHWAWAAPDGSYEGIASLVLPGEAVNRHTASLDTLVVRPDARRRGIGAALWAAVRAELVADGRASVSTVLEVGGAGEAFVDSLGFTNVLPLGRYVQRVRPVLEGIPLPDRPALPAGLRFTDWWGVVPDHLTAAFTRAHEPLSELQRGRLDGRTPHWDTDRIRAAARVVEARGGMLLTSAVLDPGAGSGPGSGSGTGDDIVAFTQVALAAPGDTRAVQLDTLVVPSHRGRGLGRAVKRHHLERLHELLPGVREIGTVVADDNRPMLAVNEALGYRRERPAGVFQTKL
ncbi:GNAT family N-acetyltransferase [Streptomyces sp. NPDC093085]|uniref:GNAT family N-acetyltransferase n=1 Tax=Streptomyces sp. NPDC093085 TaxID=3155068 RepID=UPI0034346968